MIENKTPLCTWSISYLPHEFDEVEPHIRGNSWQQVAWNLDQYLRDKIKYGNEVDQPTAQEVRDTLRGLVEGSGLYL